MGLRNLRQFRVLVKEEWDQAFSWDKAFSLIKTLCFGHVFANYVSFPALLIGPSMLPVFDTTSLVLTDSISTRFGRVSRSDIVILRSPRNPRQHIAKRVLGLEGDHITYAVDPNISDECKTVVVPKGHVWVQGDNIYKSIDSRQYGPVPYDLLEGKVFCSVWPPKFFGPLGKN